MIFKRTFLLTVFLLFFFFGCNMEKYTIVHIPVPSKKAIDFIKYKKIFFSPFEITGHLEGFDPQVEVNSFFLSEFPKVINKEISGPVNPKDLSGIEKSTLLIEGKIIVKVDQRSIIDTKKARHKKRRVFVKVENWEMELEIFFKDLNQKETVLRKKFKSKLNSADPKRPDYNFKFLFRKITENFIRKVMRIGKIESRFLFKK